MNDSIPAGNSGERNAASAYRPDPVPRGVIETILDLARRAPSGVNTQPWEVLVVQGASRDGLTAMARSALPRLLSDADAQSRFWDAFRSLPGTNSWPGPAWASAGGDFVACANAAFGDGKLVSPADLERYFCFDGAPVALMFTIDRALGLGSVLDYGMFLQNIAVAAAARNLRTDVQTGWRGLSDPVMAHMGVPSDRLLLAAMALGHALADPKVDGASVLRQPAFTIWHD